MKALIALAALAVFAVQQPTALQSLLNRASAEFPGKAGIWVKHLTTVETAGVRDGETFNSASVIKIPVLVLAFQMADKGALNLDERITIRKEDIRGGSGIFRYHDAGLQPTFRDVLLQMVITSDNTATDLAIAKVGGVARVNEWLKESGYATERLTQTTGDLFAKYRLLAPANLSQPTAADLARIEAASQAKTNGDRDYWLGEITPRGMGRMLEGIEKRTIASKAACDDMLRMMRAQQAGARRLNHFLSVPVAHKTGDFPPVLANDVGIIYARSGPIVVSFLGNAITGNYGEAEDRMGRFAQSLVELFDK
ncbi:MAG TPA: serine hydrolase [Vicinamibacterales bacterium]|nr:serine hydrolase [Vicinamibacterales bacterium]